MWSDAARRAAAMVRHAHAASKGSNFGKMPGKLKANNKAYRDTLAKTLRAARQGRVSTPRAIQAAHLAARSTHIRNLLVHNLMKHKD